MSYKEDIDIDAIARRYMKIQKKLDKEIEGLDPIKDYVEEWELLK